MPDLDHRSPASATPRVAIVGAGMSGLCMALKLRHAGFHDFTIFEKAGEVGGTWRENTYPGLSCDVPSRYYCYSFDPNPGWSRSFAPGPEIRAYFNAVADRHDLRQRIRFGQEVASARWEDGAWALRTTAGEQHRAEVLVSACGVLHHPRLPDIDGLDAFAGPAFHSAKWDHSVPLDGRRVGVIGTGSTAIQIVTALARRVERLDLYQRTAQWVLPLPNMRYRVTPTLLRRFPTLNKLAYRASQSLLERTFAEAVIKPGWQRSMIAAACRAHLRTVRDPDLRRRLTPDYEPMCKRLIMSGGFYREIQRHNVALVTDPIERIEPAGVRAGGLRELDVLVLATGFDAHAFLRPMELVGSGGATLEQAWKPEPNAYRTVALPGFPNFFMLMGPHSPFGNHSLVAIAETQADYVIAWLRLLRDGSVAAAAPSVAATDAYNAELRRAMPETVWTTGCQSWYIGADGLPMNWPWTPRRHREMLAQPELAEFDLQRAG